MRGGDAVGDTRGDRVTLVGVEDIIPLGGPRMPEKLGAGEKLGAAEGPVCMPSPCPVLAVGWQRGAGGEVRAAK
eukprot:CAMPEP_0175818856 /NCGR_PEP_ID=MMETSP0107_2-20121207/7766_1 /TAXON_ID=195067 ORGANISM="Goniomonas pacifica, Strain CCMP1869" /NCGR_SAMPLE_ID=MMETSP0107_2 /ASSEMBLY_ACC=CAM_ASM_000203 /LENGTH=73 /DNA_ID=CAMNT_0017131079 /DNA_START=235 /DNA_END=456 /DNA_ORIENTATION=-